jgi:hypothetical protein
MATPVSFSGFKNLKGDYCNVIAQERESGKQMKYYTENYFDSNVNNRALNYRGLNFHDGFGIPSKDIDLSSKSRFGTQTNINLPQNLPGLPLATISNHYRGIRNINKEDTLKPQITRDLKTCQPSHDEKTPFYTRHFPIFDTMPVKPLECWENYVQKNDGYRQGDDTRHSKKIRK